MNNMNIDDLPKEKIMQLYQDTGIILGLDMVKNIFVEKEVFSQTEIYEFCTKRAKTIEDGIQQFLKDNNIMENSVVEIN